VADGLRRFLDGDLPAASFDPEAYCQEALQDVFDKVLQMQLPRSRGDSPQSGDKVATAAV
jgi:hypothetical protein